MSSKTTNMAMAMALALTVGASTAHAVSLNTGDMLTIRSAAFDANGYVLATGGSWFGMDTNGKGGITAVERVALSQGTQGIVIGTITSPGLYGPGTSGLPATGPIVDSWAFFSSTGTNYNTVAITGSTEVGLNFSGWKVAWNGFSSIDMGSGAWGTGFTNGVANFSWDGVYGHSYTLDYHATVQAGDPSGFQYVGYALHLEGCGPIPLDVELGNASCMSEPAVPTIPEADTWTMLLAGLGLVGAAARRRKACAAV